MHMSRRWSSIRPSNSHGTFEVQSNDYCFESGNTGRGIFKNSGMFSDGLEECRHVVPTFMRKGRLGMEMGSICSSIWIAIGLWH